MYNRALTVYFQHKWLTMCELIRDLMLVNAKTHHMLTRLSAARAVLRFDLPNREKSVVAGRDAGTNLHSAVQPG